MSDTSTPRELSAEELKIQFLKACELQENNRPRKALAIYEELEPFLPGSPLLHFNMGLARFDLQQFKRAESHYLIAAKGSPEDPDIHYNLALNHRRLGKIQDAIASFAEAVDQGDSTVDTIYNMALCHQDLGEFEKAASLYDIVLDKNAKHLATLNNYAYLCHKSEDLGRAKELYEQLLRLNPNHGAAQHMLNSLAGNTPDSAPLDYVESVFDGYAETFEEKLLNELAYRTPSELYQCYGSLFPQAKECDCLDLGCGTGLAGEAFSPCCRELTGLDISENILKVAGQKKLYTTLVKDDILSFLEKTKKSFDLIIAADVFTYLGNLEPVFKACRQRIGANGTLCFSVEEGEGDSFQLKESGRFGHSVPYIEALCQKTGWTPLTVRHSRLRQDRKEWIHGHLFILQHNR